MGISRNKWHKRRKTGGKRKPIRMKRRFEIGRQPANTKLGERRVHRIRCHGGFMKYRALKLDHGNYAWPGEAVTRKCRILGVVYNPTNMEFVRTNTLVKGSIIQIDATPFKNWYQKHYGVTVGKAVEYVRERKQRKIKKLSEKLAIDRVARKEAQKKADAIKAALQAKKEAEQKKEKKKAKGADKKMQESAKEKKGKDTKPGEKKGKTAEKKATDAKKPTEKKAEKGAKTEKKEVAKGAKPKAKEEKPKAEAKGTNKAVAKDETKAVTKKEKPKKEKKEVKKKREKDSRKKKLKPGQKHHPSGAMMKRWRLRNATRVLESGIAEQFDKGRLFAKISTSPGQVGSADGYVLEGEELAFYVKKMGQKKKK